MVADVIPQTTDTNVLPLAVTGLNVSNFNIREKVYTFIHKQTNYTFYVNTQSVAPSTSQYIIVDFPQVFGLLFVLQPHISCLVTSDSLSPQTYSKTCST